MEIIAIEKPLREKLGDAGTDSLIHLLNQSQKEQKIDILEFVEEKFERRLTEEIGKARVDLGQEVGKVRIDLGQEIGKVRIDLGQEISKVDQRLSDVEGRLLAKMSESKSDMIKWMFIFWIGQVAVILGVLFAFFK
ncbi:hypothetical protein KAR48_05720 [bacterium]|nr:hypothetical protein [bacterium]